jgi:hypothetical protein
MTTKFPTAESHENQNNLYMVRDSTKGSTEYRPYNYTTIFGKTHGNTSACQNKLRKRSQWTKVKR